MTDAAPTVIVARRVVAGREQDFADWTKRLAAAAERAPGFVGAQRQPPGEVHPGEWITIYRFERQAELEGWLQSPERRALMREGEPLVDGATREQRIAEPDRNADVVTAVMSSRIKAGQIGDYRVAHLEILRVMAGFAGYVRSENYEPVPGVQDEHITVFTFASRSDLDRWLGSAERSEVLQGIDPFVEGDRTLNVVGGFGGWFAATADRTPPKWKQAIAVLVALFPMTLTLGFFQRQWLADVPWVPALFVSNVLGIAALTWLLMPLVTRLLDPWLSK